MLRTLFGSRLRIALGAVVLQAVAYAAGLGLRSFTTQTSGSVELNLWLILGWTGLIIVAGGWLALLAADLLWGERWRRRALLGWQPGPDEVQGDDVRDRKFGVYLLLVLMVALTYLGHDKLQGSFFAWYSARGFALAQLRSPDEAQRIEAVRELAAHQDPQIRSLVLARLDDPSPAVQTAAAEACGWEALAAARPQLMALAAQPEPAARRAAALLALGEIGGEGVVPLLLRVVAEPKLPEDVLRATLGALGLRRSQEVRHQIEGFAVEPDAPLAVRIAALWALGRLGPQPSRALIEGMLEPGQPLALRCAALHAVAQVDPDLQGVPKSLQALLTEPNETLDAYCDRIFVTQAAHERCFQFLNSHAAEGYQGPCLDLQVVSPEPLGGKALRAGARIAGKRSMAWLAAVNQDEARSEALRNQAAELFYKLKGR